MNTGAFGEGFPYANFHDLNMDWIIKIAKDFLDQYTNIQNTITDGLDALDAKAEELEGLLNAWYEEHSADIADALADALADLNAWYVEHEAYLDDTLASKIRAFNNAADQKALETIASIPADYTALTDKVSAISDYVYATKQMNLPDTVTQNKYWYYRSGGHLGIATQNGYNAHSILLSDAKDILAVKYNALDSMTTPMTQVMVEISIGDNADDTVLNWASLTHCKENAKAYVKFDDNTDTIYVDCDVIRRTYPTATNVLINTLSGDTITNLEYQDSIGHAVENCEKYIQLEAGGNSGKRVELTFEMGSLSLSNGRPFANDNLVRTKPFYLSKPAFVASIDDSYKFYIYKYSTTGVFIEVLDGFSPKQSHELPANFIYRLLVQKENSIDMFSEIPYVTSIMYCFPAKTVFTVSKDSLGDFDDIQKCLDYLPKTGDNTYTIMISAGTYDKISTMTMKKYVDSPTNENINVSWRRRKINLIGESPLNTIIRSDTGEYYTPSAELSIVGEVRNIMFITTHDNPPADRTQDEQYLSHKGYAVHCDYSTMDVLFRNCIMISNQAPAFGGGGATDNRFQFDNCKMYSYTPTTGEYAVMVNYGGFYYHLANASGIFDQILELKDCYVYSKYGNRSLWLQVPSNASNYQEETHLYNNIFYGDNCGNAVVIANGLISPDCFGNNSPTANYQ